MSYISSLKNSDGIAAMAVDGEPQSLQQRMLHSLGKSSPNPVSAADSADPTAETKPAQDPDGADAESFPLVVSTLAEYLGNHPDASNNAVDQEITQLFKQFYPDHSIELKDKQLVLGYTKGLMQDQQQPASATKVLDHLATCYFEVSQFIAQWGDELFKKPDDEDSQW